MIEIQAVITYKDDGTVLFSPISLHENETQEVAMEYERRMSQERENGKIELLHNIIKKIEK